MLVFRSDFQPVMRYCALGLKIILFLTGFSFLIRTFIVQSFIEQIASFILGFALISLFIYLLLMIPLSLYLEKDGLVIKRGLGKKHILYSTIKQVFSYNYVQNDIRYFGSNGFLGYIGVMGSTHYGKYYSYVKDPRQQVFILTVDKSYLISCDNRELFIKELIMRLPKDAKKGSGE